MVDVNVNIVGTANFTQVKAAVADLQTTMSRLDMTALNGTGFNQQQIANMKAMEQQLVTNIAATKGFSVEQVALGQSTAQLTEKFVRHKFTLQELWGMSKQGWAGQSAAINSVAESQAKLSQATFIPSMAKRDMAYMVTTGGEIANAAERNAIKQKLYNTTIQDLGTKITDLGKNTQWSGRQLTVGLTVPLLAAGAALGAMAYQVDKNLQMLERTYGIGGVAGGAFSSALPTPDELAQIKKGVQQVSVEMAHVYGQSATETTSVAAALSAAGYTQNSLLDLTKTVTKGMILGETDMQSAMKATISLQTAYRLNTGQTADAMNFFSAAQAATSTTMKDLIDAIPRVGPIIRELGGTYKDTVAFLVAMKEGGVAASDGANALKNSLQRLIVPTTSAVKALMGMGIDLPNIVKSNAGNVVGMITTLQAALDKLSPLQRAQAITDIFGKFQAARITALLDNFNRTGTQSAKVMDMMSLSSQQLNNIAQQQTDILQKSTSGQFKIAVESLKASLLPIGEVALQTFTKIINIIADIGKYLSVLAPYKNILGVILGGVAIAGPILMFLGLLRNLEGFGIRLFNSARMIKQGFVEGAVGAEGFFGTITGALSGAVNGRHNFFTEVDKSMLASQALAEETKAITDNQVKSTELLVKAITELNAALTKLGQTGAELGMGPFNPGGNGGKGGPSPLSPAGGGSGGMTTAEFAAESAMVQASVYGSAGLIADPDRIIRTNSQPNGDSNYELTHWWPGQFEKGKKDLYARAPVIPLRGQAAYMQGKLQDKHSIYESTLGPNAIMDESDSAGNLARRKEILLSQAGARGPQWIRDLEKNSEETQMAIMQGMYPSQAFFREYGVKSIAFQDEVHRTYSKVDANSRKQLDSIFLKYQKNAKDDPNGAFDAMINSLKEFGLTMETIDQRTTELMAKLANKTQVEAQRALEGMSLSLPPIEGMGNGTKNVILGRKADAKFGDGKDTHNSTRFDYGTQFAARASGILVPPEVASAQKTETAAVVAHTEALQQQVTVLDEQTATVTEGAVVDEELNLAKQDLIKKYKINTDLMVEGANLTDAQFTKLSKWAITLGNLIESGDLLTEAQVMAARELELSARAAMTSATESGPLIGGAGGGGGKWGGFKGKIGMGAMGVSMLAPMVATPVGNAVGGAAGGGISGAGSGAMYGGMAGMMFGPEGAVIGAAGGALIGGVMGYINAAKKAAEAYAKDHAATISSLYEMAGAATNTLGLSIKTFADIHVRQATKAITENEAAIDKLAASYKAATDAQSKKVVSVFSAPSNDFKELQKLQAEIAQNNKTSGMSSKDRANLGIGDPNISLQKQVDVLQAKLAKDSTEILGKANIKFATDILQGVSKTTARNDLMGAAKAGGLSGFTLERIGGSIGTGIKNPTDAMSYVLEDIANHTTGFKDKMQKSADAIGAAANNLPVGQFMDLSMTFKDSAKQFIFSKDALNLLKDKLKSTDPDLAKVISRLEEAGVPINQIYMALNQAQHGFASTTDEIYTLAGSLSMLRANAILAATDAKGQSLITSISSKIKDSTVGGAPKGQTAGQKAADKAAEVGIQNEIKDKQRLIKDIQNEIKVRDQLYQEKQKQIQQDLTLSDLRNKIAAARDAGDILAMADAQSAYNAELANQNALNAKDAADAKDQARIDKAQASIDALQAKLDAMKQKAADAASAVANATNTAYTKTADAAKAALENIATEITQRKILSQTIADGDVALQNYIKTAKKNGVSSADIQKVETLYITGQQLAFKNLTLIEKVIQLTKGTGGVGQTSADMIGYALQHGYKFDKAGNLVKKADGGPISGPGSATSDSIPAMLSNGEWVIKASSAAKYGPAVMNAINNGTFDRKFKLPGGVPSLSADGSTDAVGSSVQNIYNINVDATGKNLDAGDVADLVVDRIQRKQRSLATTRTVK